MVIANGESPTGLRVSHMDNAVKRALKTSKPITFKTFKKQVV